MLSTLKLRSRSSLWADKHDRTQMTLIIMIKADLLSVFLSVLIMIISLISVLSYNLKQPRLYRQLITDN